MYALDSESIRRLLKCSAGTLVVFFSACQTISSFIGWKKDEFYISTNSSDVRWVVILPTSHPPPKILARGMIVIQN